MKVINFHGGPGAGKSTASLGLAYCLKRCHVIAELIPEFAKDLVHANTANTLGDQSWVFANQERRLNILRGHAEVAVSDSPLILSAHYGADFITPTFRRHIMESFLSHDNLNYFIERNPAFEFQQEGRIHNAGESDKIAEGIKAILDKEGIPFKTVVAGNDLSERVFADLVQNFAIDIPASGAAEAMRIMRQAAEHDEVLRTKMAKQSLLNPAASPLRSGGLAMAF